MTRAVKKGTRKKSTRHDRGKGPLNYLSSARSAYRGLVEDDWSLRSHQVDAFVRQVAGMYDPLFATGLGLAGFLPQVVTKIAAVRHRAPARRRQHCHSS
jgi:hypothetical protein